jgi:hypothetical protein
MKTLNGWQIHRRSEGLRTGDFCNGGGAGQRDRPARERSEM